MEERGGEREDGGKGTGRMKERGGKGKEESGGDD